jgi:hypothetical protein
MNPLDQPSKPSMSAHPVTEPVDAVDPPAPPRLRHVLADAMPHGPNHRARRVCMQCRRRPALTRIRGNWRVVKDHDLCRQCWRSFADSLRAWKLAG